MGAQPKEAANEPPASLYFPAAAFFSPRLISLSIDNPVSRAIWKPENATFIMFELTLYQPAKSVAFAATDPNGSPSRKVRDSPGER